MKRLVEALLLVALFAFVSHAEQGGVICGSVKGPDGAPSRERAFVAARSAKTKATMYVLSDARGKYSTARLAPGTYEVWAASVGYKKAACKAAPRSRLETPK